MTKIKSLATILTTGLLAAFSALALAVAPAGASVSPTPAITSNGEAGYYAGMNAPGHFTSVKTQFFLRVAAEGTGSAGGEGIQLCNDSTGNAVQLGVRWNGVGFQVLSGSGTLTATPGTHTTPCNSGGAFTGSPLSPDLVIPQGHTVKLQLTEVSPGVYEGFAKDVTDNFSVSKSFSGLSFPDEASAGVVQDNTSRSAPASITLARFRFTRAVDSHGVSSYLGTTSEWTAVRAFDTANGLASDPALVVPGPLASGHFVVTEGGEVS